MNSTIVTSKDVNSKQVNSKETLSCDFVGYSLSSNDQKNVLNFSPGPTQFPREIITEISNDLNKTNMGITALEISHRSPEFNEILERVNLNLRKLMKIPTEFNIIWTQGGGHGQFSSIPLNLGCLFDQGQIGNYIVTGTWSNRAFNEAVKFVNARNSNENEKLPIQHNDIDITNCINDNDVYVYLCSNETVNGTEFRNDGIPYPTRDILKSAISIVDMSSDFTMKNIKWEDVDIAFACTSKNLGIAGANVLIIRNELLQKIDEKSSNTFPFVNIPCVLDWNLYDKSNSLYNTPAIYNIYIIDKFLKYYLNKGGIDILEMESKIKANMIYDMLDESKLYKCVVENKLARSNINIPFIVGDGSSLIRSKFLHFCYMNQIVGLRTKTPFNYQDFDMTEPLRISLYNGISIEDTIKLVSTMRDFEIL